MTQQLILDILPAPSPTLDNFIVGKNGAALDALRRFPPGHAIYLWGTPGAGRTHLLKALTSSPATRYFDTHSPSTALRDLATAQTMPLRLIAVDDIHRLSNEAQAAVFALYNRWRESAASKQAFALLVAGNKPPLAMPCREDLRTRLGWDLVFQLEQLSDDDRVQALNAQATERGLQLSPEIIGWILTHYARNMGQLSALLDALDHYSIERHRAITLPLLKDLLASHQP
ncbi:MAG: DnaA regulatory inactivator Hda [Burkholderiaceae bacterium]|nr:MAG: DnaA regulatory inactivator Hda [Burkholderiaceae bacterium]